MSTIERLQLAIQRIEALSKSDLPIEERRQLLAEYKELAELEGVKKMLAERDAAEADTATLRDAAEINERALAYLEPLELAPPGTALDELCRLAQLKITKL